LQEAVEAEIAEGCDTLVDELRAQFDKNMDIFEMYCMRNIFDIPPSLDMAPIEADVDSAGDGSTGIDSEIETVQREMEGILAEISTQRKRRRALKHVCRLFAKRLPQFEAASDSIREATEAFCRGTGTADEDTSKEEVQDVVDRAKRLQELYDQLASRIGGEEEGARRQSSAGGARKSSIGASFGHMRVAYEKDTSVGGGGDVGSMQAAVDALGPVDEEDPFAADSAAGGGKAGMDSPAGRQSTSKKSASSSRRRSSGRKG